MIAIVQADKDSCEKFCQRENIAPAADCMVLTDGDVQAGYVIYRLQDTAVQLLAVQAEEETLKDALVRAAMNAAMKQGAECAVCRTETMANLMGRLHFEKTDTEWKVSLHEFFCRSCRYNL
jgi:hypothetical protein